MNFPEELLNKLAEAKSVVVFSGAGMSAESGIPTFRGEDGIWKKFKPEELANFDAFMRNPDMVWEWYQYRREIIDKCGPNPGHYAIADFEKVFPKVTVITQNVDALHERAGSSRILELHGNITRNYCVKCSKFFNTPKLDLSDKNPKCECSGNIRPDVVWFGEMLPQDVWIESETAAQMCDVCFIVGTSGVVYPAAYIPIGAKQQGATLIDINITPSELSNYSDYYLEGKSGEVLPALLTEIKKRKETHE